MSGSAAATTEQVAAATTEQVPAVTTQAAGEPPVAAAAVVAPAAAEPAAKETPAPGSAEAAAAAAAPVALTPLTLPANGRLDQADLDAVLAQATSGNWSQADAQQYADDIATANEARATQLKAELLAHPEVGGAKLDASIVAFNAGLDKLLPATEPEGVAFRAFLKKSGFEYATPLVLAFSRAGKLSAEDGPVGGHGGGSATRRSDASVLFGDAKR